MVIRIGSNKLEMRSEKMREKHEGKVKQYGWEEGEH